MSWVWTRTFYAKKNGFIYNFEAKRQRDIAVKELGMEKCPAIEAYEKKSSEYIRVWYHEFDRWLEKKKMMKGGDGNERR